MDIRLALWDVPVCAIGFGLRLFSFQGLLGQCTAPNDLAIVAGSAQQGNLAIAGQPTIEPQVVHFIAPQQEPADGGLGL